jgi:choline dehydrogenase-like flavoprotein
VVQVRESCDGENYTYIVKARKEVILAGGTHNTPRLLLLSGIGPVEQLRNLSLPGGSTALWVCSRKPGVK